MKHRMILLVAGAVWALATPCLLAQAPAPDPAPAAAPAPAPAPNVAAKPPPMIPAAILKFTERGVGMEGQGATVADLLFAGLVERPELLLVERADLDKVLAEAELTASGVVSDKEATQIGRLTGAKILITGAVFKAGNKNYLVARIIGTETGRVMGKSVDGPEGVDELARRLAAAVATQIIEGGDKLVAPAVNPDTRLLDLKKQLAGKKLPAVCVKITELHLGRAAIDPAAETELSHFLHELGATLIDATKGDVSQAVYRIEGEAMSETGLTLRNLVSVRGRVEVKVLDRAGKIVAVDRQTAVKLDVTEVLAGKAALQEAAAQLAERLLPKLAE